MSLGRSKFWMKLTCDDVPITCITPIDSTERQCDVYLL